MLLAMDGQAFGGFPALNCPNVPLEIFTGLRPGEKMCEELFYPGEKVAPTRYPKIYGARAEKMDWITLQSQLQDLEACVAGGNDATVRTKLMSIVSTGFFRPSHRPPRGAHREPAPPMVFRRVAGQD
jgi:hypothetical protein